MSVVTDLFQMSCEAHIRNTYLKTHIRNLKDTRQNNICIILQVYMLISIALIITYLWDIWSEENNI